MAKRAVRIPIPTRQAHTILKQLLARLAKADTSKLERQRRGGKTEDPEEWQEALRTAVLEIEEWCPTFTLTLDPKPRERRSTRTRR